MRKNSILLSLLLGLSLLLSGCNDFLFVKPTNQVALASYEDVKAFMGGHLASYIGEGDQSYLASMSGPNIFYFGESTFDQLGFFYSDDFDVMRYPDNYMVYDPQVLFNSLQWNHETWPDDIWRAYYTNIGYYNTVLNELSRFPSDSEAENEIVSAEARVLRAWNFFQLVKLFAPYHNEALGLPLNTKADEVGTYDRRRQTQTENFAFIISELEDVLAYTAEPRDSYNIFYDKRLISGILSTVYFWKAGSGAGVEGDYQKAIDYAKSVLAQGVSFEQVQRTPPVPGQFGVFKDTGYSAFTAVYYDYSRNWTTVGVPMYGSGYYQYASEDLFALFGPEDKRTALFFDAADPGAIIKHLPAAQRLGYQVDFCTGAEMQLIIAESYARMGNDAEAEAALTAFTNARYDGYNPDPAKSLLQRILDERRKEFCFEWGMRWNDLTRLQPAWSRPAVDKYYETFELSEYSMQEGDYRYTLPIPRDAELTENKIEQNPGWPATV